jgi:hypothetical protein
VWVLDVITVAAALAFVTAAAGTINDIAIVAINNNFRLVTLNLFNWTDPCHLTDRVFG